jgi:IclR family transcriptional regulator, mhp operon transcriptional activator
MTGLKNRSLDRGIMIMEALARCGASTLADLHRECAIPKSTIRRLLGTLQARRIVRRSLADQKYRINITMPASAGELVPQEQLHYIDIAMPIITELTKSVKWPTDLQVLEDHNMRIIDSTRPLSPYHLYRGLVDRKLNLFGSATGLSCLSALSDSEIQRLIKATASDRVFGLGRVHMTPDMFLAEVNKARKRGYGVRLATYLGETVLDDGLAAIAVPVYENGDVFGSISLLFPREYVTVERFADVYLDELNTAAARITIDLEQFTN